VKEGNRLLVAGEEWSYESCNPDECRQCWGTVKATKKGSGRCNQQGQTGRRVGSAGQGGDLERSSWDTRHGSKRSCKQLGSDFERDAASRHDSFGRRSKQSNTPQGCKRSRAGKNGRPADEVEGINQRGTHLIM